MCHSGDPTSIPEYPQHQHQHSVSLATAMEDSEAEEPRLPQLDEKTLEILKEIHKEMKFDDPVVEEDINWEEIQGHSDPVDTIMGKVYTLKDKICKRFKKSKEVVEDLLPGTGNKLRLNFSIFVIF